MTYINPGVATSSSDNPSLSLVSPSTPSILFTPPTNAVAYAGDKTVTVVWTGSLPVSYFSVTLQPIGVNIQSSGSSATFINLTNGTAYTAYVNAVYPGGNSVSIATSAVTPSALPFGNVNSAVLAAWYATDKLVSPPTNGNPVISGSGGTGIFWNDASGNGRHIASSPNAATMVTSWQNSKPALLWTGASGGTGTYMLLPFGLSTLGSQFTIFFVGDITAATNSAAEQGRLISNNSGTTSDTTNRGNTFEVDCFGNGSTTNSFRQISGTMNMQSALITVGTAYVFSAVYGLIINNGGFAYINGTKQTTNDGHLQAIAPPPVGQVIALGARPPNGLAVWKGRHAEWLFYRGAMNDTDRHTIEAALGTKYNITMAVQ